ncbi:NADPH dehydrogenase NamA [Thermohalobacter berrensis]|uniref:NADPH dehydrogenase n=1 Tax=Thermohalobacter berrensis TaxID=99594 RepID=A0A419T1X1_9FIRM|nr:NADPH dehydrogenase NamA [Thermohalobacter berrensis]RKD31560.1 NADPH dehydrogenase [Thermohalobacter berrensis]
MAKLFEPFRIKSLLLPNRIVMPPMCQYSSNQDGFVNAWHLTHYATRAIGKVGLIIVEATAVEPKGRITSKDLGIWSDKHIEGLKKIVDICKSYGAKVGIQLAHAGRKSQVTDETPVAPSPIPFSTDYKTPNELSVDEINDIVEKFKNGAKRALKAGFDIIEIHSAHGYLLNEFLSPLTNKRNDNYGGSLENRVRLLNQVLKEVKKVWPDDKPISVRISAEEYDKKGNHPEDLVNILNLLKDKPDIYHVSSGGVINTKINVYPGYQIKHSEIIKRGTNKPTIAGGLITQSYMAEEILQNKRADLVFVGRELLRNPYWPLQAAHELNHEIEWPKQYERAKLDK